MMFESKRVIFLSHGLNIATPGYMGESVLKIAHEKEISKGDPCNKMSWTLSNHVGTHVDASLHFILDGKPISDFLPVEFCFSKVGLCKVKVDPATLIKPSHLSPVADCQMLLLKTGFETQRNQRAYWESSPGLSPDLADYFIKKCPSLRAIGIDCISIASLKHKEKGREAHKSFLSKNILLVEDMKLSELTVAPEAVLLAPLMVEGADASPCTIYAFLNKGDKTC